MARLLEYQGKRFLKDVGIEIPVGEVVSGAKEAHEVAAKIGKPVVVKAQVWVGGRGKAGAIKSADTPQEAQQVASAMLRLELKGFPVRSVLVEEKLEIEKEYYVGVIPDGSWTSRAPVVMFSTEGGIDVEEVPEDKIFSFLSMMLWTWPAVPAFQMNC